MGYKRFEGRGPPVMVILHIGPLLHIYTNRLKARSTRGGIFHTDDNAVRL